MLHLYEKAITNFVDSMFKKEMSYQKVHNPERLAAVTEEDFNIFREKLRGDAEKLIEQISTEEGLYECLRVGRFHPSNKISRTLFEEVAGVTLPKTVEGTRQTIRHHIGEDWVKEREDSLREEWAEKERIRVEKEEKEKRDYGLSLAKTILTESITGDELVDLARFLGVEVHPRTAGSLRKNVISIDQSETVRMYRKCSLNHISRIYKECKKKAEKVYV